LNAREKPKRGAGSLFEHLCLPLKTILRVNSLACTAESAIFPQVAAIHVLAGRAQAFNAGPGETRSIST
jgi:hypothetical protein